MKGTRHNGRSGKDGVYNPLHNDRRFDPEHSEHIDNERVRQNIYWDCYQGYTTMADRGKEDNFSFNQIEMAYYVDHYSDYVINQNKRHEKARHPDRCKGVEDVLKNKKTCPEESIYQLGTIDEHASVETLVLVLIITQISGVPVPVKSEVYEDEKGWLHVKTGSIANLRQLAEQLWPINSKMTVYYNPNNPKKCYVDRPISKSFTSMMFIIMGIVTILLSVLVFFLMQL